MQIPPEKLDQQLNAGIAPIYLISSEDSFLQQEASDKVRQAVRQAGFDQREKHVVEAGFDWSTLTYAAQSLSLFGEKKLLELYIANGKPGDKGGKALREYAEMAPLDTVLLLVMGKIDKASTNSKWFKTLADTGVVCRLWPVDARHMPQWIAQRLQQHGLSADREALQLLAERVEGNLLAAAQEVEKLRLSVSDGQVSTETVINMIGNSARYNVFELIDACLLGQQEQTLRILTGLRAEGGNALSVLGVIGAEVRKLLELSLLVQSGMPSSRAMDQLRIWKNRQGPTQAALKRSPLPLLQHCLGLCQQIDLAAKGVPGAAPWDMLNELCLILAGQHQILGLKQRSA
jgi:DNA polymerase-3 subunit delta